MTQYPNNNNPTLFDRLDQTQEEDFSDIEESLKEYENQYTSNNKNNTNKREGFSVEGKDCMVNQTFGVDDFPKNKIEVALHLASALDDPESLAWYARLVRERRIDFLKNCLRITLQAFHEGKITTTKPKYFAGVVKFRTDMQRRLEEYKKKHYQNQKR